ncbi:cytochrome P450 [Streptomyces sp. TRM 70351]|uniref:cytochrome P450 n=1 Tax=Streptomyces sp. TRM 70351 TaxID=3116552 RepID=UPI002E7B2CA2|nr:cytochrome P450 [Streptomyces sp. TRM 70351]MEE1930130.1 cytochrome P450 [Streptomyces sp. TRM 70351]
MNVTTADLTDPDLFAEGRHHAVFDRLRVHDPVHWHRSGDGGFWVLSAYDDVAAAYNDHTALSSEGGPMLGGSFRSEADPSAGRMLVASDPPRQRMIRQAVHRAFTTGMIRKIARQVSELVDAAVARAVADGGCDFATDIAPELPAGAVMAMMGVSHRQAHELIGMTRRMIGFRDPFFGDTSDDERLRLAVVQSEIFEFFSEIVRDRRANPGEDLASYLLQAEANGRPWPEEMVLYNCMNVAVGGNETSSYTACAGLVALLENPGQLALLREQPQTVDSAVNEILRWSSTNAYVMRVATQDLEIRGRRVSAGDSVTLWNVSANRDPSQFPDAHRFDVTRSPNRHLSYGVGIHRCIGAMVAQTELGILFRKLADNGLDLALAGEPRRLRSNFIQGITAMPVHMSRR